MRLYEALVTESRWIAPSMALAGALAFNVHRRTKERNGRRATATLTVLAGTMVGTMAFGHLFAVSLKLAAGDLYGSLPVLLGIGVALAVPSWLVTRHGLALGRGETDVGRTTVALNGLLVAALLLTGPLNAPLAVPALLAAVHAGARSARVKRATLALAVTFSVLLFAGALRFFVSGESFEDFSGMEAPPPLP